jgi:hypothetical protein
MRQAPQRDKSHPIHLHPSDVLIRKPEGDDLDIVLPPKLSEQRGHLETKTVRRK